MAKENISLWSSSSGVYPPPDSDILEIPFTFKLPASLPPSFECVGATKSEKAHIRYGIAIVGKRPGVLRHNQRITKGFPVLPPDPSGAELREALQRGWTGPWRTSVDKKQIRKGLWGDHSEVEMTVSYCFFHGSLSHTHKSLCYSLCYQISQYYHSSHPFRSHSHLSLIRRR